MAPKSTTKSRPYREIEEFDQANNLVATYIQSPSTSNPRLSEKSVDGGSRIDVVVPQNTHSYARSILNAFLPAGYPNSVTSDYLEYQIYDSLQAFSSSIAGLLSSRAVLEGIGVGDVSASPTSALLLSVLQDSMGRVATILFAHRLGSALEPECKMYRLLADVFNDAAMILDCLSPVFPKSVRVGVLGGSSVLRSLCGVAAGSSKASLSAHFAVEGNLGELNAKDSSQETVISLLGMLFGTLVVSHISSKWATWTALLVLLAIHIGTNYLAVRAVCMRTLNRQRANLVFGHVFTDLLTHNNLDIPEARRGDGKGALELKLNNAWPSPAWVRMRERVFERDGVLRVKGRKLGWCQVGVSLQQVIGCCASSHPDALTQLLDLFVDEKYIIAYDARNEIWLTVLKDGAGTRDVLAAWMLVLLVVICRDAGVKEKGEKEEDVYNILQKAKTYLGTVGESVMRQMEDAGWDLEAAALETKSGFRVKVKQ